MSPFMSLITPFALLASQPVHAAPRLPEGALPGVLHQRHVDAVVARRARAAGVQGNY